MKYEVEYKVELSEAEAENLRVLFKERGFTAGDTDQQDDYYIEAKESQVYKGKSVGYDLKRYRNESGTVFYTEKTWEMAGDVPARKEIEREATLEEFEMAIAKYPNALKIKKTT